MDGHHVLGISRRRFNPGLMPIKHVSIDIARAKCSEDWLSLLSNIDVVVNCAGALQDAPGESLSGVHTTGLAALFSACVRSGVRRVVHLSAVGVDERHPTQFSRTKLEGDEALMRSGLDWVILRPSVVIGRSAYGGSALLRGLAGLPVLPVVPNTSPIRIVHLDDLVETVRFFIDPDAPSHVVIDVAGPRSWQVVEVIRILRRWLRYPAAVEFVLPKFIVAMVYCLGDTFGILGWRPAVRSTARVELSHGVSGDPREWQRLTGFTPRDFEQSLTGEPASIQERWFARIYLLKPLVLAVLSLFWIATGLISYGPGWDQGLLLLQEAKLPSAIAAQLIASAALADLVLGLSFIYRPTSRFGLRVALVVTIVYIVIATIFVPRLWFDPLGPLLKVAPIFVLNLVALAVFDDR